MKMECVFSDALGSSMVELLLEVYRNNSELGCLLICDISYLRVQFIEWFCVL